MKLFYSVILVFLFSVSISSYAELYRIFFRDKGFRDFNPGSPLYESALKSISKRSIERRMKFSKSEDIITIEDAPIFNEYIKQIENFGCKIRLKLKWLNYIVAEFPSEMIDTISHLPFVRYVQPIRELIPDSLKLLSSNNTGITNIGLFCTTDLTSDPFFGKSANQLNMIGIDSLLMFGVSGDSIIIGILDTGFRWKFHNTTNTANVLAEWDFINWDSVTQNEEQDTLIQDVHGSMVMSILSAYLPGSLIGSSPFSQFILAKTEDIRSETHFEEDCFAMSIEWMDSIGVDVITSSLGYSTFDSPNVNYEFSHLNGNTSITSYYANLAVQRGISMITAAGNKGPKDSTIQAPGDAFYQITVGAVNISGDSVLNFSSRGPTSDGRIKPDVCALGKGVAAGNFAHPDSIMFGSGTSVAAPLIAGGVALIRSAFEEISPIRILNLLHQTSSFAKNPRNDFGWGVPNFYQLALSYDILISDPITFPLFDRQRIVFNIDYKFPIESVVIFIRPENDSIFYNFQMRNLNSTKQYFFDLFERSWQENNFNYYVLVKATDGNIRRKPFFPSKFFHLEIGDKSKNIDLIPNLNYASVFEIKPQKSFNVIFPSEFLNKGNSARFQILSYIDQYINISVFDFLGNEIITTKLMLICKQTFIFDLNLSFLQNGIYFLRLASNSGDSQIIKFIVLD